MKVNNEWILVRGDDPEPEPEPEIEEVEPIDVLPSNDDWIKQGAKLRHVNENKEYDYVIEIVSVRGPLVRYHVEGEEKSNKLFIANLKKQFGPIPPPGSYIGRLEAIEISLGMFSPNVAPEVRLEVAEKAVFGSAPEEWLDINTRLNRLENRDNNSAGETQWLLHLHLLRTCTCSKEIKKEK